MGGRRQMEVLREIRYFVYAIFGVYLLYSHSFSPFPLAFHSTTSHTIDAMNGLGKLFSIQMCETKAKIPNRNHASCVEVEHWEWLKRHNIMVESTG